METIPTNSELNWEFVEPLNEKALSGLEDQLKMGLSDAFKDFVKRSNYGFSQWRSFMVGNKSYTFKHVLNFNLEGKGLLIDFMKSLKEWLEPEEIIFANDGYGGYYLLNTASGVVLFLDTDDGSKHALLHIKMFLIKRELKDLQKDEKFWTESSQFRVSVPVGWDINHKEVCFEIGEAQNHTLICGRSGSGKSNFLHVLIQNLAFYYAPNEVQLFLLDYKNEMRLHLGKEVDYDQKDLIVEFESNESHLLVVSQDLNARIALMKLFAQNFKTANKELLFYNAEKRLVRELDELKKHHITPMQSPLGSALNTAMNPNGVLMIDNLNEAKELHDKIGVEKLKSFLEKATDNEQYCIIFAHDFKQIDRNYNLDKLKELLNNHFKQRLAFKCNRENLSALKSEQKLHELNARLINTSKDSHTEFRPFSL
ncbi:hypothetical protein HpBT321_07830 [Helicobacter pylori]